MRGSSTPLKSPTSSSLATPFRRLQVQSPSPTDSAEVTAASSPVSSTDALPHGRTEAKGTPLNIRPALSPTDECHKLVQFLWSGSGRNIVTSDAGMYGELREGALRQIFLYLSKECSLNQNSILCDIGSGRGCPNIVALYQCSVGCSVGVELGNLAYILSQKNNKVTLEREIEMMEREGQDPASTIPNHRLAFIRMDAAYLQTFDPITHIYSFDAAMPGWLIFHLCKLFNASKTTFCYCSFRSDLIEKFWLKGIKKVVIPTAMSGSGEGRSCHIYMKYDWKIFSLQAFKHTAVYLKSSLKSHRLKENKNLLSSFMEPSNLIDTVKIAWLPAALQNEICSKHIEGWYASRSPRSTRKDRTHVVDEEKHAQLKREEFLIEQTEKCDPLDNPFLTSTDYWKLHDSIFMKETGEAISQISEEIFTNSTEPIYNQNISSFFQNNDKKWLRLFQGIEWPSFSPKYSDLSEAFLSAEWADEKSAIAYVVEAAMKHYKLNTATIEAAIASPLPSTPQPRFSPLVILSKPYQCVDANGEIIPLSDKEIASAIQRDKDIRLFHRMKALFPMEWEARQRAALRKAADEAETLWWVHCDKCRKWRLIPSSYPPEDRELIRNNAWECKMNFWDLAHPGSCRKPCDWKAYMHT